MAFQLPNNNANQPAQAQNENWKNDAFINIYLPSRNGGRRKLGSIGLKMSKPAEKELIEFLRSNDDGIMDLMSNAEVDFRMVDDTSNGFDLPSEE